MCGVPRRRPAVATRLPLAFPLETRHWHTPAPCLPRDLAQYQSKHSACGTEGTGATLRLQLQERGPRRGSDLPKDIRSALSLQNLRWARPCATLKPPFILRVHSRVLAQGTPTMKIQILHPPQVFYGQRWVGVSRLEHNRFSRGLINLA